MQLSCGNVEMWVGTLTLQMTLNFNLNFHYHTILWKSQKKYYDFKFNCDKMYFILPMSTISAKLHSFPC